MNTNFDQLLDFPCHQTFKILGVADDMLTEHVVGCLQIHSPGDYSPRLKASSKGTYHSLSLSVRVTSKEHMETIYTELAKLELVRMVL
jgi:putative lipoic acid-binding regulatory protein